MKNWGVCQNSKIDIHPGQHIVQAVPWVQPHEDGVEGDVLPLPQELQVGGHHIGRL